MAPCDVFDYQLVELVCIPGSLRHSQCDQRAGQSQTSHQYNKRREMDLNLTTWNYIYNLVTLEYVFIQSVEYSFAIVLGKHHLFQLIT